MFRVDVDDRVALRVLKDVTRQVPFASAKALNEIALFFQKVQRSHQEKVFTIRQKTWWKRAVKMEQFASRKQGRRLEAIVSWNPPRRAGEPFKGEIFTRQEEGELRRPRRGGRHLAIQREGVRTKQSGLPRKSERPRRVLDKGAFIIEFGGGYGGVFRRNTKRGRGRQKFVPNAKKVDGKDPNIEFLYFLIPQGRVKEVYEFFENAEIVWDQHWRRIFREQILKALDTARPSVRAARRARRQGNRGFTGALRRIFR